MIDIERATRRIFVSDDVDEDRLAERAVEALVKVAIEDIGRSEHVERLRSIGGMKCTITRYESRLHYQMSNNYVRRRDFLDCSVLESTVKAESDAELIDKARYVIDVLSCSYAEGVESEVAEAKARRNALRSKRKFLSKVNLSDEKRRGL